MRTVSQWGIINKAKKMATTRNTSTAAQQATDYRVCPQQRPTTFATLQQLARCIARHFDDTPQPIDPLGAVAVPVARTPQNSVEAVMAQLWAEVLGREAVGRHDTFVALGGHPLLAMRLAKRIRETFAVGLPLSTMLTTTVITMANSVLQAKARHRLSRQPDRQLHRLAVTATRRLIVNM